METSGFYSLVGKRWLQATVWRKKSLGQHGIRTFLRPETVFASIGHFCEFGAPFKICIDRIEKQMDKIVNYFFSIKI